MIWSMLLAGAAALGWRSVTGASAFGSARGPSATSRNSGAVGAGGIASRSSGSTISGGSGAGAGGGVGAARRSGGSSSWPISSSASRRAGGGSGVGGGGAAAGGGSGVGGGGAAARGGSAAGGRGAELLRQVAGLAGDLGNAAAAADAYRGQRGGRCLRGRLPAGRRLVGFHCARSDLALEKVAATQPWPLVRPSSRQAQRPSRSGDTTRSR